ncbi:hypothetical protein [Prescottella subtropica]|uniref:hypothetical protein n=1 Tax=Prescottella subtropica TaxID=2545757 RepID=UPI0010F6EC4E|nr:hypothetical protein [Prescottella subtropica]
MSDTLTATDAAAEFIAQETGIEVREAMSQAQDFIKSLHADGFTVVPTAALEQNHLAQIVASRRGATAHVNDTDRIVADRLRTHLIGNAPVQAQTRAAETAATTPAPAPTPAPTPAPAAGQVWADNDPRVHGRTIAVDAIDGDKAICTVLVPAYDNPNGRSGHAVKIAVRRFKPTSTGYRLIRDEHGTILEEV